MKAEGGMWKAEERPSRTSAKQFFPPSAFRIFLRYWLPLISYSTLIVIQSHFPTPDVVPRLPFFDKLLHAGGYGLLGLLFCRAYRSRWRAAPGRFLARRAVLSAALFGLSDEIHQHFVPFRTADPWDVLADAVGAAIGVIFYFALLSYTGRRAFRPIASR
jgi:VanZ family protein